jgi:DNA-directed RNA polymerase specialized sigma24 family protein
LYTELDSGARFFLWRRTGSNDVDDLVHELFLTVVQAIRDGQLREPERLMGFVRTVLFRVAGEGRVAARQAQAVTGEEMNQTREPASTPEQSLIQRENIELMQIVMRELRPRDVEILNRFYFLDQMEEQIRSEMNWRRRSSVS